MTLQAASYEQTTFASFNRPFLWVHSNDRFFCSRSSMHSLLPRKVLLCVLTSQQSYRHTESHLVLPPPDQIPVANSAYNKQTVMDHVRTCHQFQALVQFADRKEVEEQLPSDSWQRIAFDDFRSTVLAQGSGKKTFPCVYASIGYRANEHRYVFCNSSDPSDQSNVSLIAAALRDYLDIARELGDNTSLVIVCKPADVRLGVTDFSDQFWTMLSRVHDRDHSAWPAAIPQHIHDANWTFCFAGEQIFPIQLTPAHDRRFSRHASVPIIALQPKWILDKLLGTAEKRELAQNKVRKLLKEYDSIEISPDLAAYGTEGTLEARQLCLLDENEPATIPSHFGQETA